MAVTISSLEKMIFPFLYLSSGYLALLVGYWGEKDGFMELRGTDVVILTFVVGSFELLSVVFYMGIPKEFTGFTFAVYTAILAVLTLLMGLLIKGFRKKVSA
jgi:hypothetical protein